MGEEEWRDVVEAVSGCFEKDSSKDYEVRQDMLTLLLELFDLNVLDSGIS